MRKCNMCGREYKPRLVSSKYCSWECRNKVIQKYNFKPGHGKGESGYQWKGEKATYGAIHSWVLKWKGKATECSHCGTTEKRKYHWANINHEYKRNLDDYIPLCVPCHRKYNLQFKNPKFNIEEANRLFKAGVSLREIARRMNIGCHATIKRYIN